MNYVGISFFLFLCQMLERDKAHKEIDTSAETQKIICKTKPQPVLSQTSFFMYFAFISFPYLYSVLLKA